MKYIVGISKLKEVGEGIVDYSSNNLKENIAKLNKQKWELKWEGPAYNEFIEIYDKNINKLFIMEKAIEEYGLFLEYCSEHYHDTQEELAKGWREYLEELESKTKKEELKKTLNENGEVRND